MTTFDSTSENDSTEINSQEQFTVLVHGEKVRILYKTLLSVIGGNFFVSAVLAYGLWDYINHTILLTWVGFIYLLTATRIPLFRSYFNKTPEEQNNFKWGYYFALSSFLSGILWGIVGIVFFTPDNPFALSFVTVVLLGMVAVSTASLSSYTPAHYAYITPTLLPLAYSYLTSDLALGKPVSVLAILYLLMNMIFSRNIERTLSESIELRFKNATLIKKLTQEKEKAIAASNAKSRFLASANHDLRQPLHALGLFIGAMELHATNNELHDLVGKTKQSYSALEGLLDVLLDISKLDAGVIQPKPEAISVQKMFDSLLQDFEYDATSKGLKLRFHSTNYWVLSDPTLLARILRNLICNAIRYTDSGAILVGCRYKQNHIVIEIHDSGRGIAEENLSEIFKEFRQLDNPERDRSKGLGLGLAIVERLSHLLKHHIDVSSKPGQGSVFKLHLPQTGAMPNSPPSNPDLIVFDKLAGLKILAIDDESHILDGMKQLLTGWGCSTSVAETSDEACLFLRSHDWQPDIILVDYRLRNNQTGADAIRAINKCLNTDIPAIIITGDTAPDRIQEAKKSGYPILHKPIQPARLRSVLQQQVNKRNNPDLIS